MYHCVTELKPEIAKETLLGRRLFNTKKLRFLWISTFLVLVLWIFCARVSKIKNKCTVTICMSIIWFLLLMLPFIIFLINYNKIFKRKTFNYCFVMNIIGLIIAWGLVVTHACSK